MYVYVQRIHFVMLCELATLNFQQKIKRDHEKRNARRRMGGRQPIAEKKGREW